MPLGFPRSAFCQKLRLTFLCIYSASFKLLLLRLRFRQPCIASGGHTTLLVSSPQRATRFHKKFWNLADGDWSRLWHQKSKKSPMTAKILLKFFQTLDSSLAYTRFMAMVLLTYAGFLRRLKDVISHSTCFELFIDSSSAKRPFNGFYFLRSEIPVLCIISSS